MRWAPFSHEGKQYDLHHLHPKTVTYLQPAKGLAPPRSYKVEIIFSLHCFTRGMEGETPDPALLYSDSRDTRIFDFRRYELSHHLPAIIDLLMTRKCFHTGRGNYFTVEIIEQGQRIDYEVYFAVSKASKGGLNLYVQSAYGRDTAHRANRPQRKPIAFSIILFNTLTGRPIKVPT